MSIALILVRWLHLSASILLASLFLFEQAIIVPALRKPTTETEWLLDRIRGLICRGALWTLSAALTSWFVWGLLVALAMTGDELIECLQTGHWLTVLTGTQFGHLWLFRLTVSLLLGILLWLSASRPGRGGYLPAILAGLSLVALVSLAWVSHAAAGERLPGLVHFSGDAIHLLTSAFWPGALAPLVALLILLFKSNRVEIMQLASPIIRRFSAGSLIAVTMMALTGLLNSIFMVGSFRALLTSAYGQLLVTKVMLFLVMIGFGAWNRFKLIPRMTMAFPAVDGAQERSAVRSLLQNVLWEIGLGGMVILIVALLGTTPPPMR